MLIFLQKHHRMTFSKGEAEPTLWAKQSLRCSEVHPNQWTATDVQPLVNLENTLFQLWLTAMLVNLSSTFILQNGSVLFQYSQTALFPPSALPLSNGMPMFTMWSLYFIIFKGKSVIVVRMNEILWCACFPFVSFFFVISFWKQQTQMYSSTHT